MTPRKVRIVIPLYNEEETLPTLIYRMRGVWKMLRDECDFGYVIVNDGSRDRTPARLREAFAGAPFVTLVDHERNQGFGAALKTGITRALAESADLIGTIDGDTNYDHFLIPLLLAELTDDCDLVTASPWHPEGGRKYFPAHRLILSLTLSWLYRQAIGAGCPPLYCYSAGFRIYRRQVLETVDFQGRDFLATAEIMARALLQGYRVKEYPVNVSPRSYGTSKMRLLRQIVSHFQFLRWLRANRARLKAERNPR